MSSGIVGSSIEDVSSNGSVSPRQIAALQVWL
jgi:hypothetical protein